MTNANEETKSDAPAYDCIGDLDVNGVTYSVGRHSDGTVTLSISTYGTDPAMPGGHVSVMTNLPPVATRALAEMLTKAVR